MTTVALSTWLFLLAFAVITVLHALSLKRIIPWSFRMHCAVMGTLWSLWNVGIITLIVLLPMTLSFPLWARATGILLSLLGLIFIIWHRLLLGRARLLGGRFFDARYDTWTSGGLYRYLSDPIYDGIFLLFAGLFLWRGNTDFLLPAAASLLLLNCFLAPIENTPTPRSGSCSKTVLLLLLLFFTPLSTAANGGMQKVAEGKYIVNVSAAPIAPYVGETQKLLIGFADISGTLIEKDFSVDLALHFKGKTILDQKNLLAKNGILPFDYTYRQPGIYELFVRFRLPDEPNHTYTPEDFLIDVKEKYGGARASPLLGFVIGGAMCLLMCGAMATLGKRS